MQVCPFFASNHPIRLLNLIQFDPCRGTLRSHQAWCLKTGKYPMKMEVLLGKWSIFIGDVLASHVWLPRATKRYMRLKSLLPIHLENVGDVPQKAWNRRRTTVTLPRLCYQSQEIGWWLMSCRKTAIIIPGTTCHCQWSIVLSSTVQLEYSDVLHIRVWERVLEFFKLQSAVLGTSNSQVAKTLGR